MTRKQLKELTSKFEKAEVEDKNEEFN